MRLLFLRSLGALVGAASAVAYTQGFTTPSEFVSAPFDIIIVGGGTAGLVLANRLSDPDLKKTLRIGVIEAGLYNLSGDPLIDVPYQAGLFTGDPTATLLGNPKYDWMFNTIPQPGLNGKTVFYPRAKILGGCSAHNNQAWHRGMTAEYDAWGTVFGADGWSFKDLLPYFIKTDNWTAPTDKLFPDSDFSTLDGLRSDHGKKGFIHAKYSDIPFEIESAFAQASVTLGATKLPNTDGGNTLGMPEWGIPSSIDPATGKRSYAAPGYYGAAARQRSNLAVVLNATATRIIWDPQSVGSQNGAKATGVEFIANGQKFVAQANMEVIVSGGTMKSPHILELSGVGNPSYLNKYGVPVVINNTNVGENLQDHVLSLVTYSAKPGIKTLDPLVTNTTYAQEQRDLFTKSGKGDFQWSVRVIPSWKIQDLVTPAQYTSMRNELDQTISSLNLTPMQKTSYDFIRSLADGGKDSFVSTITLPHAFLVPPKAGTGYITLAAFNMHEFSRGSIHINGSDPLAGPSIDPNFFAIPWDVEVQRYATKYLRTWAEASPANTVADQLVQPLPSTVQTDNDWDTFVRNTSISINHPVGTVSMAAQNLGGVVDCRLKVYGSQNVRVVDASVIPLTVSASIQATVYAIAEKASDLILQDHKVKN